MPVYLALLRAVNLGRSTTIAMEDLRKALGSMGLANVRSVLQSGNVVFDSPRRPPAELERELAQEIATRTGLVTDFFVRSAPEWAEIVRKNPFAREAEAYPAHLTLTVLRDSPTPSAWSPLVRSVQGPEKIRGIGREAYITYPNGIGRPPVTIGLIERKLGTRGTSRNWNTVRKLADLRFSPGNHGLREKWGIM